MHVHAVHDIYERIALHSLVLACLGCYKETLLQDRRAKISTMARILRCTTLKKECHVIHAELHDHDVKKRRTIQRGAKSGERLHVHVDLVGR